MERTLGECPLKELRVYHAYGVQRGELSEGSQLLTVPNAAGVRISLVISGLNEGGFIQMLKLL